MGRDCPSLTQILINNLVPKMDILTAKWQTRYIFENVKGPNLQGWNHDHSFQ